MTVRTGTVNGLPCVGVSYFRCKAEVAELTEREKKERRFPVSSTEIEIERGIEWTCGLPSWWPRRPTQQCIDCGLEIGECYEGHFCYDEEADDTSDKVRVTGGLKKGTRLRLTEDFKFDLPGVAARCTGYSAVTIEEGTEGVFVESDRDGDLQVAYFDPPLPGHLQGETLAIPPNVVEVVG